MVRSSMFVLAAALIVAAPRAARAQAETPAPPTQQPDEDLEIPAKPAAPASAPDAPAAPVAPAAASLALDGAKDGAPARPDVTGYLDSLGLVLSGYVQAQYESNAMSEDQLQQGGTPLNRDRFTLRRARLRVDRAWEYAAVALELDGNTVRGLALSARRAEASLVYRADRPGAPPLAMLTAGLTEIPFGYELTDSARRRVFMERSAASLAFFPGEPDLGVRLSGGISFFRYSIAAMNGEPVDERPGRLAGDPNKAKDVLGRVGVDTRPTPTTQVSGGASFLYGKGFHRGTDATKNQLVWRDLNENGGFDQGELTPVPGSAATPSVSFERWATSADLQLGLKTPIGWSRLYGEVTIAQNLDRGLFAADPVVSASDLREFGYYVAFTQEITKYGLVGLRMDYYDPNADFLDKRVGKPIPASQAIRTFSPLVGLTLEGRARLLLQYDFVTDSLARDASGVPTDLKNDQLTLRLQVEL